MVAEEGIEIVRRLYERWLDEDPAAFDLLDDELELHPDPGAYWVGVNERYRGHQGLIDYLAAINEAFDDYRPEIEDFLAIDDKVVTLAIEHGRGKGSGAEVEHRLTAHVWTLREGKAVRVDLYLDRARALRDLGLE